MDSQKWWQNYGVGLLLMLIIGVIVGHYALPILPSATSIPNAIIGQNNQRQFVFPTFWEAWDDLHQKFIGNIKDQDLYYGAVAGMVSAAHDPYTVFSDPAATKSFQETIDGNFSGIGVEMGIREGAVTVITPLDGSPAQKADIRAGDIVVAVDGKQFTSEMTLDDAVKQIRGKIGTTVKLTVLHKNAKATTDITITRDTINVQSVKLTFDGQIAHLIITSFNSDTATQFNTAARTIVQRGAKGIILDVRNNPGGFLQTAVDIASRLIPEGQLIVSEKGKTTTDYKAEGNAILKDIPIVVLANEGSASSAEILTGALKDDRHVKVIGTKTFGKGSVQELIKLQDNSSLRVTVAKWFTPSGQSISEKGIEPDVKVEQNYDTPQDEPLLKAQEEIQKIVEKK
jgi:carboxyl-terminal processing protease